MNTKTSTLTTLLGTASFMALASSLSAQAQQVAQGQMAQAVEIPETVLITGSLIRGTAAVGVPVTNLSSEDFVTAGALTTADLFRTVPAANLNSGQATQASRGEKGQKVNIRGFDSGTATRSLMMVDGVRFPAAGVSGQCALDPSIIPQLAMERIDVLVDGASATYGSDAMAGVINIVLRRGFDGAMTQVRYGRGEPGRDESYMVSQLWGRTWDGGDITLTYEWYQDTPAPGSQFSKWRNDYRPWGIFDDRRVLGSSMPGTISAGRPAQPAGLGIGTVAERGTNCTNCWAIPDGAGRNFNPINAGVGPTAPFSASTLNWAAFNIDANRGTNGAQNIFDPFLLGTFLAENQRSALVMTFDQRLTSNVSMFFNGFYNNRRSQGYIGTGNALVASAVPTWNPYYPTGGAPTNLRVSYNFGIESPPLTTGWETAGRYHVGLNIDLPGDWAAVTYYSMTRAQSRTSSRGAVQKNLVSAALGWTMPSVPAAGADPGISTWVKPATLPYLNLFCDPTVFGCNSPATLAYLAPHTYNNEITFIDEKGITADGPLFDVPAGQVKMAVGAQYISSHSSQDRKTIGETPLTTVSDYDIDRNVWAVFGQINVPIISDVNALPGIAAFEFEASWRHDQYSDLGLGTSNPKIGFNWTLDQDFGIIVRGAWGTSFRAPAFGEISPVGQANFSPQNNVGGTATATPINILCEAEPGSAAYKLLHPTVGPAWNGGACGNAASGGPLGLGTRPGGMVETGSSIAPVRAGWRDIANFDQKVNKPETAQNWAIGVQFAPTAFLQGLNAEVSWYKIKLTSQLTGAGQPGTTFFNAASRGFAHTVPTDLFAPNPAAISERYPNGYPGDPGCNNNNTPTTCKAFQDMIQGGFNQPTNQVPVTAASDIYFILDSGTYNKGSQSLSGIDFSTSYDWDWGNFGAFNVGVVGTYYIERITDFDPRFPDPDDAYHTTVGAVGGILQEGVQGVGTGRLRYRARVGWASSGGWSATAFMNYIGHYFHTQAAPPNVNFQCTAVGGTLPGGTFPCLINNYTNIQPAEYQFDLSFGYDTGDTPTNEYLRNVGIQLVVQNVLNRDPAFQYRIATGGGSPSAFDISKQFAGRQISLTITKTW